MVRPVIGSRTELERMIRIAGARSGGGGGRPARIRRIAASSTPSIAAVHVASSSSVEAAARRATGIDDEEIEPAERIDGRGDAEAGPVGLDRSAGTASPPTAAAARVESLAGPRHERDPRALRRELRRDRRSEPARGAADQGPKALQPEIHAAMLRVDGRRRRGRPAAGRDARARRSPSMGARNVGGSTSTPTSARTPAASDREDIAAARPADHLDRVRARTGSPAVRTAPRGRSASWDRRARGRSGRPRAGSRRASEPIRQPVTTASSGGRSPRRHGLQ